MKLFRQIDCCRAVSPLVSGRARWIAILFDTQIAVFYPLEWFLPLFVKAGRLPLIVYQRYIFLHCLLGAVFVYAFLRE